jgi:hypothetical protein
VYNQQTYGWENTELGVMNLKWVGELRKFDVGTFHPASKQDALYGQSFMLLMGNNNPLMIASCSVVENIPPLLFLPLA